VVSLLFSVSVSVFFSHFCTSRRLLPIQNKNKSPKQVFFSSHLFLSLSLSSFSSLMLHFDLCIFALWLKLHNLFTVSNLLKKIKCWWKGSWGQEERRNRKGSCSKTAYLLVRAMGQGQLRAHFIWMTSESDPRIPLSISLSLFQLPICFPLLKPLASMISFESRNA